MTGRPDWPRVLLVTPPMSDLNTPYPATTYLSAHLKATGIDVEQADWSLELFLRLFTASGLEKLRQRTESVAERPNPAAMFFLAEFDRYLETIDPVVRFVQGRDLGLCSRIARGRFLPDSPQLWRQRRGMRFDAEVEFGRLGEQDLAKSLCGLFLRDLAEVVAAVEPGFSLRAYAESLGQDMHLTRIREFLDQQKDGLVARTVDAVVRETFENRCPDVLGLTVPFPGNLVGALRVAECARRASPEVKIVLGGGFANTSLRELDAPELFDDVDYVTLDDGERPLVCLLEHLAGRRDASGLLRTFRREEGEVVYSSSPDEHDVPFVSTPTPIHAGLKLDRYPSITSGVVSRVEQILTRRCNKLTLAHGCYWRKCSFCDISLDYVGRYEPQRADRLVEHIEALIEETGWTTFHWVDEAAPPSLLRALAERLLERRLAISWYGNIRFEKTFTDDLVDLLVRSGCVLVMGGLEVASDRLLELMQKGVTVAQVARVANRFASRGACVHAYLMHGFPSETLQETVDSLERVRQLFAAGCLQSGRWHRFFPTPHSPIGQDPEHWGLEVAQRDQMRQRGVAYYGLPFSDRTGVDHDRLKDPLRMSMGSYLLGKDLDRPAHEWFGGQAPPTSVAGDLIATMLRDA